MESKTRRQMIVSSAATVTGLTVAGITGANQVQAQQAAPTVAPPTNQRFSGKVVLVTGSTSGIGRATAVAFAREGANVIVTGRRTNEGEETVAMVKEVGGDGRFIRADLRVPEQIDALFQQTLSAYGRLDAAFNNAGIAGNNEQPANTHEYTFDSWNEVMMVNLTAVWRCMKHEITQMLKQGGGAIVNTGSTLSLRAVPGIPAYCASKHALMGLTEAAAIEYATRNIRVNIVLPGPINTPLMDRYLGGNATRQAEMNNSVPMKRLGNPNEVAKAVLWLCSNEASFTTGTPTFVDGGISARE
ncbi:glucose 1-dehydrogenase [Oculatella sp. LEGE 06141]|uniref:glucose 1-dehydrogenase n=1 Tax=Oculatella sp. LEGE 06141 TaxID=1828648 RepID=UPI0030DA2C95